MDPPVIITVGIAVLIAVALLVLLTRIWWEVQVGLFPGPNVQATHTPPGHARSESTLAVNPRDEKNLVGASKRFFDLNTYLFDLVPIFSLDGGQTWQDAALPMEPGWDGMTDPTIAFDGDGRAYLIGEPLVYQPTSSDKLRGLGMFAFRSLDGGRTWQRVAQLSADKEDDKQWVVCDTHPHSPHRGNVYVFWGAGGRPVEFARSTDHGLTWTGVGQQPSPSALTQFGAEAPDHAVSPDGTLHVFWYGGDASGGAIEYLRSTDGGNSFVKHEPVAKELTPLAAPVLQETGTPPNTWPHFDHATFRVRSFATSCTGDGGLVAVAWSDIRDGQARIYYQRSLDYGANWDGPEKGQPLLNLGADQRHCFHPQLQATANGVVGCAFYSFGPESDGGYRIRVQATASWDDAKSFPELVTVSDRAWDPALNAPELDTVPGVTFIGEYFGLDTGPNTLGLLWTDTRTGFQELWSDVIETVQIRRRRLPMLIIQIITGVIQDGGGLVLIGGKVIRIPPRSPVTAAIEKLAAEVGNRG
jgi:hypothetical protein